jgi:hypothetical protein
MTSVRPDSLISKIKENKLRNPHDVEHEAAMQLQTSDNARKQTYISGFAF